MVIDPPYNTNNKDFKYNDRFVDKEDTWRHSNWLSFMNKRLILAKKLLSEKGIIFINIDDNELAQLKLLCDEIFGENNKLGIISVVNNLSGRSDDKFFATSNEFMLVYAKNIEKAVIKGLPMSKEYQKEYKYKDNISNYKEVLLRKTGKGSKREDRPNMYYPIYFNTKTKDIYLDKLNSENEIEILPLDSKGNEGRWRWGKDTFNKKKDTEIVIKLNSKDKWTVYEKTRDIVNGEKRTQKAKTTWINPKYDSGNGTVLIKDLFNDNVFTNPKPLEFILDILRIATDKNDIVLDFFAGSGTTGHAVLELNKEDGGNRQFILCTNNENKICEEITYQRLNKVINGYTSQNGNKVEGIGGNLNYFRVKLEEKQDYLPKDIKNLIDKCTGIISIKEDCYNLLENNSEYDIISNNNDKVVLIYKVDSAFDYEVKEVSTILNSYNFKNKIIYSTKSTMEIKGIKMNEYPKEIIELISQNKKIQ